MDLSNSIEVESPAKNVSSRYRIAGLAEFDIVRDGVMYAVVVREQKRKDQIVRLQITVTNKEQDNDSDYLIMRKANYSPRSLEDYLS